MTVARIDAAGAERARRVRLDAPAGKSDPVVPAHAPTARGPSTSGTMRCGHGGRDLLHPLPVRSGDSGASRRWAGSLGGLVVRRLDRRRAARG
ncbi:hypothetical protein AB5I41_11115 [Sphingomonas sp. MMS24-JH45]